MSTPAATLPAASTERAATFHRYTPWLVLIGGALVLQLAFRSRESFPAELDTWISDPVNEVGSWMRDNRLAHPLFTGFFTPISRFINSVIETFGDAMLWLPWYVLILATAAVPLRVRMWREALVIAGSFAYVGLFGFWDDSIETLALMSTSVMLAVVIGVPLGMWAALDRHVESVLRPLLDAAQTVPAFVYFLPLLMLFGLGNVPAAVTTIIYALPPVVRLTTLGIKQVPSSAVEASDMFGATRLQTLTKVQFPMALRSIITGMSQTVMMALGIAVLATLVGADGLGSPVNQSLNQRRTGRGIAAGLAIVAIAFILDRLWRSFAERDPTHRVSRRASMIGVATLISLTVAGKALGHAEFPHVWSWTAFDPIDDAIDWIRDNTRWFTRPFSDLIVTRLYLPIRDLLTDDIAWVVLVFVTGWLCWHVRGWWLATFATLSLLVIGAIGLWEASIDTLVQVSISTVLALAVAIPLGVWAGRSRRVYAFLSPVLDAMQTIPSLVYIIPAVTLFTVGVVPGIIATVVYTMVPGVRITALGIQQVPHESVEASETFGATPRQTLLGVRIPLAAPTIMMGVNQVIMMVLAMVIITGLVGGGALGFMTIEALTRSNFGQGFEVGLALVLMAMILDRLTEACADRLRPPSGH